MDTQWAQCGASSVDERKDGDAIEATRWDLERGYSESRTPIRVSANPTAAASGQHFLSISGHCKVRSRTFVFLQPAAVVRRPSGTTTLASACNAWQPTSGSATKERVWKSPTRRSNRVDPPAFANCRGISYICDNPGAAFEEDGLPVLRSQIDDINLLLYQGLAQAIEKIGKEQLVARHGVCVTPPWSYHVTVQDLVHYGNIHQIRQPERNVFEDVFARLPVSVVAPLPMQFPPTTLPLPGRWKIRFRVSEIAVLPSQAALIARLAPVDEESERSMTQIEQWRRELDEQVAAIGKPPNPEWAPHITLGYFANPELALDAAAHVERWSETAAICTLGRIIEFGSISLYAFTTMDKFWRFPLPAVLLRSREIEAARRDPKRTSATVAIRKSSSRTGTPATKASAM